MTFITLTAVLCFTNPHEPYAVYSSFTIFPTSYIHPLLPNTWTEAERLLWKYQIFFYWFSVYSVDTLFWYWLNLYNAVRKWFLTFIMGKNKNKIRNTGDQIVSCKSCRKMQMSSHAWLFFNRLQQDLVLWKTGKWPVFILYMYCIWHKVILIC